MVCLLIYLYAFLLIASSRECLYFSLICLLFSECWSPLGSDVMVVLWAAAWTPPIGLLQPDCAVTLILPTAHLSLCTRLQVIRQQTETSGGIKSIFYKTWFKHVIWLQIKWCCSSFSNMNELNKVTYNPFFLCPAKNVQKAPQAAGKLHCKSPTLTNCLQSGPCMYQNQGFSLPTWTASGSWRARCWVCSISLVRPGRKTNCWRGSSITTRWHYSISKAQRAGFHRLVFEMLSQMWIIATSLCAQDVLTQKHCFKVFIL